MDRAREGKERKGKERILDQVLVAFDQSSCCSSCCWGDALEKSLSLRRFKSDRDELRHDCSSSTDKYTLIDGVGFQM